MFIFHYFHVVENKVTLFEKWRPLKIGGPVRPNTSNTLNAGPESRFRGGSPVGCTVSAAVFGRICGKAFGEREVTTKAIMMKKMK